MSTLISNPDAKAKPMFDPLSVAKPMLWLSVALYLVSFALPVSNARYGGSGFIAFTYGLIFCLQTPWLWVGWLANGVYWVAVTVAAKRRWQQAACLGGAASSMALSVQLIAAGPDLSALGPGYWVWLGSMVLLTCAALLLAGTHVQKGHQTKALDLKFRRTPTP